MKILLVEDEVLIAKAIKQVLKKDHYLVDLAFDGQEGLDLALSDDYDVIVLDILLPIRNGLEVLREIRKQSIHTPIIMLTAKNEVQDKIFGLNEGADDYLSKPFDMEELVARIHALSRRHPQQYDKGLFVFGNSVLDSKRLLLSQGNKIVSLTMKETQILELLIINVSLVISKERIIEKIWGYDSEANEGNVETQISLLRKKLLMIHSDRKIKTIRKVGYLLEIV